MAPTYAALLAVDPTCAVTVDVEKAGFNKALDVAERCENCILECHSTCAVDWCRECVAAKRSCAECQPLYGEYWHPDTRPCRHCAVNKRACVRLRVLIIITDQEAKVKKGLEACVKERNDPERARLFAAAYDAPHTIRIVLRAAMNWTVHDPDGCAVTYRVANAFKTCKNQDVRESVFFLSTSAALLQDRMSERQVAALNSARLQRVFEKYPGTDRAAVRYPHAVTGFNLKNDRINTRWWE